MKTSFSFNNNSRNVDTRNLHHQINRLEFVNLSDAKGLHGLLFVPWIPTAQNPAVDFSLRFIASSSCALWEAF